MATIQFKTNGGRGIEWCDVTINPIGGCKHACRWKMPDGRIAKCYAEELAENGVAQAGYPQGFAAHYWRPNALREMHGGQPLLIFIDSMSDMFGHWVGEDEIRQVFAAMRDGGQHTFQALTKNPRRYLKFLTELPPNLWCGASSAPDFFMGKELSRAMQERYMRVALETLTAVRDETGNITWMSVEPLSWDVADIIADYPGALDWVIVGAASDGPRYFQPDARHVDRLLDVLDAQGVAVFYKGNIKKTFELYDFGTAAKNRWREEFPTRPTGDAAGPAPAVVRRQLLARRHGWTLNPRLPEQAPEPPAAPAPPPPNQPSLFG